MLKRNQILASVHLFFDMTLIAASFIAAYFTKRDLLPEPYAGISTIPNYYIVLLLVLITSYFSFTFHGFYRSFHKLDLKSIIKRLFKGIGLSFLLTLTILYILKSADISRVMIGLFLIYSFVTLLTSKVLIYEILYFHFKRSYHFKNILIVGSRERARGLVKQLKRKSNLQHKVIGCLDHDTDAVGKKIFDDVKVIGTMDNLADILENDPIDEIVFACDISLIENVKDHIAYAEEIGINIRILPDWQLHRIFYKPETARVSFEDMVGMKTILLSSQPRHEGALIIKNIIDYLAAGTALSLTLPLFITIAAAIKLTSKGPIFFRQVRCGQYGRKFSLIKFRTMVANAEELKSQLAGKNEVDGPVFKMKKDPRITLVGGFLRKTSLDELPQLINILRGEMSVVGPRPPIPDEVKQYKPWQRRRLSVKPGLTRIWQVSGRNNIDFKSWMNMDLEYIDRWSLWLDIKLMFYTIPAVLLGTGK